jgi:hypothetical protein
MEVRSVEAIVSALNNADVKYLVVGGVAVNAHGYERATRDLDLVIGLAPENIIRGLNALRAIGYNFSIPVTPEDFANPELRERWRKDKQMVVLRLWSDEHRRTPVDVFVYEPFVFETEYQQARWEAVNANVKAPILRYDTLITMKRAAGRPQDLADIDDLQKIQQWKKEYD